MATKLRTAAFVLVAGLAGLGGWRWWTTRSPAPPEPTRAAEPKRGKLAFPVEVLDLAARPVEYALEAVGSVDAFEVVEVTARVAGVVERVAFAEGDAVGEGTTLAEIDPARYSLGVRSAEAAVERAEGGLAEVQAGLTRRELMRRDNAISQEELDTWRARARAAAAEVAVVRVALERAQLDLKDAILRAPRAGRVQTRSVRTGQWVQPGDVLTTLVVRDPLLLRFHLPEGDAARVARGASVTFHIGGVEEALKATIVHVAETADPGTRMVAFVAHVDAAQRELARPGAFAQVSVPLGVQDALVIPQLAVRPSDRGFMAFVVEGDRAVERVLSLGLRTADGRVEVRAGLAPGERLVVRGAEALREGAPVRIVAGDQP